MAHGAAGVEVVLDRGCKLLQRIPHDFSEPGHEFPGRDFRSGIAFHRQISALLGREGFSAGIGQEPVEAAGHVAEVKSHGSCAPRSCPQVRFVQAGCGSLHILEGLKEGMGHGLKLHGNPRDRTTEPDFGLRRESCHSLRLEGCERAGMGEIGNAEWPERHTQTYSGFPMPVHPHGNCHIPRYSSIPSIQRSGPPQGG